MTLKDFRDATRIAFDGYIDENDSDDSEMTELVRQVDKADTEYNRPFARFSRWIRRTS